MSRKSRRSPRSQSAPGKGSGSAHPFLGPAAGRSPRAHSSSGHAIARLVRSGETAEIAFEVADAYHGRGIGSALTQELVMDACVAGIVEVTAFVRSENLAALALLSRVLGQFELRFEGPEMVVRAPLPARC
ncbi:MAG TPA: GNAT family N-acetyltransferase [Gaiellaceae bacterium]|nr:GNAT family N-acetyltransferase [Gaiellaceae bacterium]